MQQRETMIEENDLFNFYLILIFMFGRRPSGKSIREIWIAANSRSE